MSPPSKDRDVPATAVAPGGASRLQGRLQIGIVVPAGGIAGKKRRRIRLLLAHHHREDRRNHQQRGRGRHHQATDDGTSEGAFHLATSLEFQAIGTMPIVMAHAVIKIGRRRSPAPATAASAAARPRANARP